jgi:putative methionine-R-sulfoxide reductase with GAF domain
MEPLGTHSAVPNRVSKPVSRSLRRAVRQKVHTPAYASLNGGSDDMVLDLSEILDISESGAAIQTSSSWGIRRVLNLCIDLSETNTYLQTTGHVVWADRTGKIGVRFPDLPEPSRRKLKEWLFLNAMVGAANWVARHGEAELPYRDGPIQQRKVSKSREVTPNPTELRADYTATLTALAAVQREVEAQGANLDSALQLIAERSRTFTMAEGSAIAIADGRDMLCRASAGDAPPVGAKLEIGSGFSGYCARSGYLQRCDDAETDSRVDKEGCRALGIRSIIAVPIRLGESVVGLLEVFSSRPHAFNERHGTILQRLADTILAAVNRSARLRGVQRKAAAPQNNGNAEAPSFVPSFGTSQSFPFRPSIEPPERKSTLSFPVHHLILLVIAAISIAAVLTYLLVPTVVDKFRHPKRIEAAPPAQAEAAPEIKPVISVPASPPLNLDEVRKRAELGDPYEQVALATRYATGQDVPQDYSMAVRWFTRAAEQGHVGAQDALGTYYWVGRGVPKDVTRAYFWSILARASGKDASKVRVAFMTSQLTRGQAVAIQQEANSFLRQHPPLNHSESAY